MGGAIDMNEKSAHIIYFTPKYSRPETMLFKDATYRNDIYGIMLMTLLLAGHEPHWFNINKKPRETYKRRLIAAMQKTGLKVSRLAIL